MSDAIPRSLIEEIKSGRASLFLGAGASCEADFPDSNMLAEYIIRNAGEPYLSKLSGRDLATISDFLYLEQGYGRSWVEERIGESIRDFSKKSSYPPSKAHEIMTLIHWRTIFTTNYDNLIENSYLNSNRVQDPLPIYSPDNNIKRHDKDIIRIIKLNGSVDEMSRNSKHHLVLTFADQQDARSQNREFYDLLREEAINGPIIFIGFRFQHPGASSAGSSPEFSLLKDLLRDMGSARWHYCITPDEPNSLESELAMKTLSANQIHVINLKFGEFFDLIIDEVKNSSNSLLKRPPIIIPIAHSSLSIEADEYSRDRRHFEVISSHLQQLPKCSVAESLNGGDNWCSFFGSHFIERKCKKDFFIKLNECINNPPGLLSLVASPGWGKSFFLKSIALEVFKENGRPVLWLNPFGTLDLSMKDDESPIISGKWDEKRIDYIIGMINKVSEENKLINGEGIPILVADNCPERVEEILSLFRYLSGNNRQFILIIAFRDNEFQIDQKNHALLKRGIQFFPEKNAGNNIIEVRNLIDFCEMHKVGSIENSYQKEIIARRITESRADISLILALQIIYDGQHRPFSEIIKGFWNSIDDINGRELVLRVVSLHRFGSIFYPRLFSLINSFPTHKQKDVFESYDKLILNKIIFEDSVEDEPCVRTLHALVASEIAKVSKEIGEQVDNRLLLLVSKMSNNNERDLEIIRRLLKHINYYMINLSSEDKINELFKIASEATNDDWVVCHQYSNYLLNRREFEGALNWIEQALHSNPYSTSLLHTKGNILRHWGMDLKIKGDAEESIKKFEDARRYFAMCRVGSDPSEYGYVTHLDMLLHLINKSVDDVEKANLIGEGTQLYMRGIKSISQYRFNILTDDRYNIFRSDAHIVDKLLWKIEKGLAEGRASTYGTSFLADNLYNKGYYNASISALKKGQEIIKDGIILWTKEAELHAREGNYNEASKCLDSARRREVTAESDEANLDLAYWDLIVSFILQDSYAIRNASVRLRENIYLPGRPRGYIWRKNAKDIKPENRSLRDHAKIWSGRIKEMRGRDGRYGRIELDGFHNEPIYVYFNPRYFARRDFRKGQAIRFAIAILPEGLRAESLDSKPFIDTVDNLYV